MQINKARIINFRNIKKAELEFNSAFKFFVFYGSNGAGKTSILEALSLINSSKGMLKANLKDMVNIDSQGFGLLAELNPEEEIKIEYQQGKKDFFINGERLKKLSQLGILGSICWLSPVLDRLFYDSKKPRRDYFDRLVYSLDKNLVENLNSYSHLVQSRFKLLKEGSMENLWIDTLEKDISKLAIKIHISRNRYIKKLNKELKVFDLSFRYSGSVEKEFEEDINKNEIDVESLESRYQSILKGNRFKDTKIGSTSFGVHRSNIKGLNFDNRLGLEYISMGQHKKALINLIIGHVRLIKKHSKEDVCLLIDEITSHLDEDNKLHLFNNLENLNVQTFLTGVRKEDFNIIKEKAIFIEVDKGIVI
ncbi:MAG: AAA family ATPase [Proteobacteria bacterium]|nr:AAA family ATPase [Pseudomonadota bacterium]